MKKLFVAITLFAASSIVLADVSREDFNMIQLDSPKKRDTVDIPRVYPFSKSDSIKVGEWNLDTKNMIWWKLSN